jgi:hypothetical protein
MRKKWTIVIGLSLVILVGLVALLRSPLNQLRSLATLTKIDDHPLYVMRYYGDYGFEDFLQQGTRTDGYSKSHILETAEQWTCTCFTSLNREGEGVFGRNFDWHVHPALILFTVPPDGYASVSMVDISYLGYGKNDPSWIDRPRLLRAPYLPFDGMNERGVTIGMMAVPSADPGEDPQKVTISSLQAIRLMLDYAASTEEAISLLRNYNVDFEGGPPLHYLISDPSGKSAIVEFVDGEMIVLRNRQPWQVATNFVISTTKPEEARSPCWRYRKVYEALERAKGDISQEEAMALLEGVSQSGSCPTIWSVAYNMTTRNLQVVIGRKYDEAHRLRLDVHVPHHDDRVEKEGDENNRTLDRRTGRPVGRQAARYFGTGPAFLR